MERQSDVVVSVPDKTCEKLGCRAKWGIGNELFIYAGKDNTKPGVSVASSGILGCSGVHQVRWDCHLYTPSLRKLVNETQGIFVRVQQEMERDASSSHIPKLMQHSMEYRSVIKACALDLQSSISSCCGDEEAEQLTSQLQMLETMELVWSLCELLLFQTLPAGNVLLKLLDWQRIHFVEGDNMASNVLNSDSPSSHDHYWPTVYIFVLQGRVADAQQLLSLHPERVSDAFILMEHLLSRMPIYTDYNAQSRGEFELQWSQWQGECMSRQRDASFVSHPQLHTICQMLCGEDEVFSAHSELLGSWYCMLISRLLYQNPIVNAYDIQHHAQSSIEMYGGSLRFQPFDHILLSVIEYDTHQVIKDCSSSYGSWWFASHLTDLLFHCNKLESQTLNLGANLREFLLLEYATSLLSHHSLWQIGIVYLDHCPEHGRFYQEEFVERLALETEKKTHKVLQICEIRQMTPQVKSICKVQGMRALGQGRLGSALSWAFRSKDVTFATSVAERFLEEYSCCGSFRDLDLLDHLGPSMLLSSKLTFLGKYREMHRLYEDEDFRSAASLLLSLLKAQIAPPRFWPTLLMDALPLLEAPQVIYSSEETYELFHCLSEITTNNKLQAKKQLPPISLNKNLSDIEAEKIELIRLALARNLSRALIQESSL